MLDERANGGFGRGVAENEVFQNDPVVSTGQNFANRFVSVAAGPSTFLNVVFELFGQIEVVNVSNICLIDSHSESDCCHNQIDFVVHESILDFGAMFVLHSSVISTGVESSGLQFTGDHFSRALQGHINDSRAGGATLQAFD